MQNKDRVFFIIVTLLALGTLMIGTEATAEFPFLSLSLTVSACSLIAYFLFYTILNTGWFYHAWILNGILIGIVYFFEGEAVFPAPLILTVLWLAVFAADYLLRQKA